MHEIATSYANHVKTTHNFDLSLKQSMTLLEQIKAPPNQLIASFSSPLSSKLMWAGGGNGRQHV